jgi:hypothetical protein
MQLDLIILTKAKENNRYCELLGYHGKALSTHVSNILTSISVPAEDGWQQSATFTHAPSWPALSCPLQVFQAKHKH